MNQKQFLWFHVTRFNGIYVGHYQRPISYRCDDKTPAAKTMCFFSLPCENVSWCQQLCLSSSDAQRHQLFQEVCNSCWHAVIKGSSRFAAHIPQEWESEVSAPMPSVLWARFEDLRTISRIINNVMLNRKNTNKTLFQAGGRLQHLCATL